MGEFKKSGGFGRGGNQGHGFNRQGGQSDRPRFGGGKSGNPRPQRAEQSSYDGYTRRDASPARGLPQRDFTQPTPSSKPPAEDKRIDELKQQLDAVNKKLDTMIEMMKVVPVAEAAKAVPTKKAKVRKLAKATRESGERSSRRMTAKK